MFCSWCDFAALLWILPSSNSRWRWSRKALLHGRRKLEQGAKSTRLFDSSIVWAARKRRVQIWIHFSPVMDSARCNSHMQVLRSAFSKPAQQHGSVWLMSLPQDLRQTVTPGTFLDFSGLLRSDKSSLRPRSSIETWGVDVWEMWERSR